MKTCLLNLPYPQRIMRRYNCTYYAPNFLFPPLELMYLGAIVKKWKNHECILIDAVAEGLSLDKVIRRINDYQPDLLVFMAGIESFEEDMQQIARIKLNFPKTRIGCIGYLSSVYPKETLERYKALDFIIMDEPEISFSEFYDALQDGGQGQILGVIRRRNGNIIGGEPRPRIKNLDMLPFPQRSLIRQELYHEFLLKRPFTTIQASRGCPFECTFCVRSYRGEVAYRSLESVFTEIEEVVLKHKIKTIRFMDDTFTLDKGRVMRICNSILEKGLKFNWSCLSRPDTIDEEMTVLMRASGCRRIYLGIETSSQRLLDFYKKGYRAQILRRQIKMIKDANIEIVGFFMVGGPQKEEELRKDIKLTKDSKLDYIVVEKVTPYPATSLFGYADNIKQAVNWEKIFYRDFYFRTKFILFRFKDFVFHINDFLVGLRHLYKYLSLPQSLRQPRQEMI